MQKPKLQIKTQRWPKVELGEVLDYEQPTKYIVSSTNYKDEYPTPVLTAGKSFVLGYTDEKEGIFPKEKLPVIIFDDFTTAIKLVEFPFKVKSSAMKILHAKKDRADVKFLFYVMLTIKFEANQHKRYWISKYSKIMIPLPPLKEQKKIVAKLEKILSKIKKAKELRESALEDANKLLPSTLHQVFSCSDKESWEVNTIKNVSKDIITGSTPNTREVSYFNGGIVWVTPGDLFEEMWVKESSRTVTHKAVKFGKVRLIPKKAVILVSIGATVGKLAMAADIMTTNQQINSIVFNERSIIPEYGYYYLLSIREKIINIASASTFPIINKTKTGSLQIAYPKPLKKQREIVRYLDKISEKARKLQELQKQTLEDLDQLEQSILHQAFQGKL